MDSSSGLPRRAPGAHGPVLDQRGFPTLQVDAQVLLHVVRLLRTTLGNVEHDLLRDGDLALEQKRVLADTLTESADVVRGRTARIIDSMSDCRL